MRGDASLSAAALALRSAVRALERRLGRADLALHRREGAADDARDLLEREALDATEQQRDALVGRELLDDRVHGGELGEHLGWRRARHERAHVERLGGGQEPDAARDAPASQHTAHAAHDDAGEEAAERLGIEERVQPIERDDVRVLHDVVDLVVAAEQAEGEAGRRARVSPKERLARPQVTSEGRLDERRVGRRRADRELDDGAHDAKGAARAPSYGLIVACGSRPSPKT